MQKLLNHSVQLAQYVYGRQIGGPETYWSEFKYSVNIFQLKASYLRMDIATMRIVQFAGIMGKIPVVNLTGLEDALVMLQSHASIIYIMKNGLKLSDLNVRR